MTPQEVREIALAYQAVYNENLREEMKDAGIILNEGENVYTEDRDGYGDDKKFTQDTDKKSFRPGTDVPPVKKFGRISRVIPHGIGAHKDKTTSRVSTITNRDPGAPKSQRLVTDKKEQVDLYDLIFAHLLDEGYANTPEAAVNIMVNMSEKWINSIVD